MNRFFYKMRRNSMFLFVFLMPFGVRVDPEHPNEISLSVHGGTGQVISVLRDCDGNVTASEESNFNEVAASAQVSHRFDNGNFFLLGVRSGKLDSQANFPTREYAYPDIIEGKYEREVNYSYWNPYLALEGRKFGLGVGYFSSEVPWIFGEYEDNFSLSGHLRLGNYRGSSWMLTLFEDLPLAAGSGFSKLGVSYPAGSRARLFTGISAGFYEDLGLVQQASVALSDRFDLDLSTRLGSTAGKFQGGVALGLRYHLPYGSTDVPFVEPEPKKVQRDPQDIR